MNPNSPLIGLDEVLTQPIPQIRWLIEGFIGLGTRTLFYGETGSMKTWVLLHMALCMASGQRWMDCAVTPQSVLYIDEEMAEGTLRRRVRQLAAGLGIAHSSKLPLKLLSHAGIRMDSEGAVRLMTRLNVLKFRPQVIIFETLRRILVGKENEAEAVGAFWRNLDPLFTQGTTLIVAHHMRKPNQEGPDNPRYRASGTTDLIGGCDNAIALNRSAPRELALTMIKSRDAEENASLAIQVQSSGDTGPVRLTVASGQVENWERRALALCNAHPTLSHKTIYHQFAGTIGTSYTTYWRRMAGLRCIHQPLPSVSGALPASDGTQSSLAAGSPLPTPPPVPE